MPAWLKKIIIIAGVAWAALGLPFVMSLSCVVPLLVLEGEPEATGVGIFSLTLALFTTGAGLTAAWHAFRSLHHKPSRPQSLPPAWMLAGLFGFFVAVGLLIYSADFAPGLFFPPILLIAAALPPLLAVSWFANMRAEGLTWRRGVLAFAGGATAGVIIALLLEILLPVIVLALVSGLATVMTQSVNTALNALAGEQVAKAITSPGFIFLFVQLAIIAPLAEEFAKPLVTLPLMRYLSRRDAFLVAAMAGAGFAALENVIYAGMGFSFWAGILVVRALGGAIHPLGAGLVGLGWRDILRNEANAWPRWFIRFGAAAGMHALWNGGSLLVITLAGAQFFGELPPDLDVLGFSAAGTLLALLMVLGLATLWIGRSTAQRDLHTPAETEPGETLEFSLSDRTLAIWALACLVAIVPAGIAGLQLLIK